MSERDAHPIDRPDNALDVSAVFAMPSQTPPRIPDYELLCPIGRGAYGVVWMARTILGEKRAVKVVYRRNFDDERPYEREFAAVQKFEPISRFHPGQVSILHVGRNDAEGCFYYVMELADDLSQGSPLHAHSIAQPAVRAEAAGGPGAYTPRTLKAEVQQRRRLPVGECVQLGISLAKALEYLHEHQLVHRDVKPSNIIFVNGHAKLADIGLVTRTDATRSHVGTLGFTPPDGPGTVCADLYSLGKVLYEAATGRDRQDFPELPSRLGNSAAEETGFVELNQVLIKACDPEVTRRYQNAAAMRADLELLQSGESLVRKRDTQRRLKSLIRASAGLVLIATAAALLLHWRAMTEDRLTTTPEPELEETEAGLPNARSLFADLDSALQSRINQYASVNPGLELGKLDFVLFQLNAAPFRWDSAYYDAVRFTTPPQSGLDMVWAFTMLDRTFSWSIRNAQGRTDPRSGFRAFSRCSVTNYENVPLVSADRPRSPSSRSDDFARTATQAAVDSVDARRRKAIALERQVVFVQGLPGKYLEPNREYLLLFAFPEPRPVLVRIALNFVPDGLSSETNLVSLEHALGLRKAAKGG